METEWSAVVSDGSTVPVTSRGRRRARAPLAQHTSFKRHTVVPRLLRTLAVMLATVLIAAGSVAATIASTWVTTLTTNSVALAGEPANAPNIAELQGGANILLMGVDACEEEIKDLFGDRCKNPEEEATLNDVNIVVHISAEPRRVIAITFPRDLIVDAPECTTPRGAILPAQEGIMINALYEYGGISCVAQTIEALSGGVLDIQFGAMITWAGVIELTSAIGGVEVCVAERIRDPHTGLDLAAGLHTLEGFQALQFLRTRYGLEGESDVARVGNQQVYMSALVRKIMSERVLTDLPMVLRLAQTTIDAVTPTTALANPATIVQLAMAMKDVPLDEFTFVKYPVADAPWDKDRLIPLEDDAAVLFQAIADNRRLVVQNDGGEYGGAVITVPSTTPSATPSAVPEPSASAGTSTDADEVLLPLTVTGFTPADNACSNGGG
ncbi:LCP family protein [Microbacterium sp. NC79]|uniref:LCP family protein n=1 Tax=Microbacterium sp. NC79 TaxID=2851009 RepID=UPI001C2C7F92|nr:LCP family protein [Microbacterium sp. NC79]MBV0893992.1 LCP family protein [Microbacterium sp. NC79]